MSRLKKFKENTKKKVKRKAWRTGKKLGKSYLEYKAVTGALRYGKRKLLGRKKQEEKG